MERKREGSVMMWALVAIMLSQNLVILPVMCISSFEDQKNYYYPPDPHTGTPSIGSHGTPPSHSGSYGMPPSHGGSGHGGGSPPSNCGGSPPSGGGHHHHTPTLSPPSGHGGGYSYTPPSTPVTFTPPSSPIVIPGISTPHSPPFVVDPNSPPFSCNYWRTHPTLIWGLFGWAGTMGGAFGLSSIPTTPGLPNTPGLGSTTTLQQALANVRTDGYGALYREGTAALLNSMVDHSFPFTTSQVRDSFVSATKSNNAASAQAHVFRLANEGRLKN